MKYLKNKQRNSITDKHLKDTLIVANNNNVKTDYQKLLRELLTITSITLKLSTVNSYYVIAIVGSLDIFNKNSHKQ